MTDLEQAKMRLAEGSFSCVVVRNGKETVSLERGVKPLLDWLQQDNRFFAEASVADKVIGKAAAMLFVLGGAKTVHAKVLSEPARQTFETYKVAISYDILTDRIKNRSGTGLCPMESRVLDTDSLQEAYIRLQQAKL